MEKTFAFMDRSTDHIVTITCDDGRVDKQKIKDEVKRDSIKVESKESAFSFPKKKESKLLNLVETSLIMTLASTLLPSQTTELTIAHPIRTSILGALPLQF